MRATVLLLACLIGLEGCGRIGFDSVPPPGSGDGATSDDATAADAVGLTDAFTGVCSVALECSNCAPGDGCSLTDGCCGCNGGVWQCSAPNPVECPPEPPQIPSVCTTQNLGCEYCPYASYRCFDGTWMPGAPTC